MTDAPSKHLEVALAASDAALADLRAAVAKETGDLIKLADEEGLDDDSVFYALKRLVKKLPENMRPMNPDQMVGDD